MAVAILLSSIDGLLVELQPKEIEISRRKNHEDCLKASLKSNFGAETFTISASLNRTLLPHEAVELTQLLPKKQCDKWCSLVNKALCQEASSEYSSGEQEEGLEKKGTANEFSIDSIRHSIKNNYVMTEINHCNFKLSPNNLSSLFLSAILEEVNLLVGQKHLLKRSLMLIKAWCMYESGVYSPTSVINLFGYESLVVIVIWLFSSRDSRQHCIDHPFRALLYFQEEMSTMDWESKYLTMTGLEEKLTAPAVLTVGGILKSNSNSTHSNGSGETDWETPSTSSLLKANIAKIVETNRIRYESFFVDEPWDTDNAVEKESRSSFFGRDSIDSFASISVTDTAGTCSERESFTSNRDRLDSGSSFTRERMDSGNSFTGERFDSSHGNSSSGEKKDRDYFNTGLRDLSMSMNSDNLSLSSNRATRTPSGQHSPKGFTAVEPIPINGMIVLDPIDNKNMILSESAPSFICRDMVRNIFKRGLRSTQLCLNHIIHTDPAETSAPILDRKTHVADLQFASHFMPLTVQMVTVRAAHFQQQMAKREESMKSVHEATNGTKIAGYTISCNLNLRGSFGGLFPASKEEKVKEKEESEFFFDLDTPLAEIENIIRHAELVASSKITAESIINLVIQVLNQYGPLPIGEIGKQLQTKTGNPEFPKVLKKSFSGLKKFISSYPSLFKFGDNHNFNPLVFVLKEGTENTAQAAQTAHAAHTAHSTGTSTANNHHSSHAYHSNNALASSRSSVEMSTLHVYPHGTGRQDNGSSLGSMSNLRNNRRRNTPPAIAPLSHSHYSNPHYGSAHEYNSNEFTEYSSESNAYPSTFLGSTTTNLNSNGESTQTHYGFEENWGFVPGVGGTYGSRSPSYDHRTLSDETPPSIIAEFVNGQLEQLNRAAAASMDDGMSNLSTSTSRRNSGAQAQAQSGNYGSDQHSPTGTGFNGQAYY